MIVSILIICWLSFFIFMIYIKEKIKINLSGRERLLYINYSKQINKLYKKYCFKNIIINPYPLKLVRDLAKNKNLKYNDIQNISISDPMQGFKRMTNDEYVLEHCFGDKDYFEYMEMEYKSIFD